MRPKKTRWVKCTPGERCFQPQCKKGKPGDGVVISLDEFEVMRLCFHEGYDQKKIARQMKIHQSTISRILASALKKTTDAFVNLKAIKIEGGCCQVVKRKK
jgi:uncharacterized protein